MLLSVVELRWRDLNKTAGGLPLFKIRFSSRNFVGKFRIGIGFDIVDKRQKSYIIST